MTALSGITRVSTASSIVTKDSDFNELVIKRGYPPKVVWIRRGNCTTSTIEHLLRAHAADITMLAADDNVVVSLDAELIRECKLTIAADLYYRPTYLFRFIKIGKNEKSEENKLEELNAITGEWDTVSAVDLSESAVIPWDKVMRLTLNIAAIVLTEFGPLKPFIRTAKSITSEVSQQLPGIIDDIKRD